MIGSDQDGDDDEDHGDNEDDDDDEDDDHEVFNLSINSTSRLAGKVLVFRKSIFSTTFPYVSLHMFHNFSNTSRYSNK